MSSKKEQAIEVKNEESKQEKEKIKKKKRNSDNIFEDSEKNNGEKEGSNNLSSEIEEKPIFHIKKVSNLSDSIVNYFAIGISLFIFSAYNLKWFELDNNEYFSAGYFLFSGCSLYIIGILNWYEGKGLLLLFDFIFSFFFFSMFLKSQDLKNICIEYNEKPQDSENNPIDCNEESNKLFGIFYILVFSFLFIIAISSLGKKGILFSINYFLLFLGFLLSFIYQFCIKNWVQKFYSYIFIIDACYLWILGTLKLINNGLINKPIKLLEPTD